MNAIWLTWRWYMHTHSLPSSMNEYISKWQHDSLYCSRRTPLFLHLLPLSLSGTCCPQFGLDRSLRDMIIAPDQCLLLARAAWSPRAGTCFCRYHPRHYYTQGTRGTQRWGWLQRKANGKRLWGRPSNPGHARRRGHTVQNQRPWRLRKRSERSVKAYSTI